MIYYRIMSEIVYPKDAKVVSLKSVVQKSADSICLKMFDMVFRLTERSAKQNKQWESQNFEFLEESKQAIRLTNQAVQIGLAQTFSGLNEKAALIDWGMGQATNYPLSALPESIAITPVEPSKEAVINAYKKGRISQDVLNRLITNELPPYPITDHSIDGIFSITALHVLPLKSLQITIDEFRRILKPNRKILALQDVAPGWDFLSSLTPEISEWINSYILTKYPSLSYGNIDDFEKNTFWSNYLNLALRHISQQGYWDLEAGSKFRNEFFDLSQIVLGMSNLRPVVDKIASHHNIPLRKLRERFKNEYRGLTGVLYNTAIVLNYLKLIPEEQMSDKFQNFIYTLSTCFSLIFNDIYEAYLVYVFKEKDFEVETGNINVVINNDVPNESVFNIDGSQAIILESSQDKSFASVRKFVAKNEP